MNGVHALRGKCLPGIPGGEITYTREVDILPICDLVERAGVDDVGNVAGVDVRVALPRLRLGGGGAVALVTELHAAGGRCGAQSSGGGVEALVVAVRGVRGVDGGVAQPLVLGDVLAACSARVEGGLEDGDVQARVALDLGDEVGGGDGGAADGGVGQAGEKGAGALFVCSLCGRPRD